MASLFFYYTFWHYTKAPLNIVQIWKNFLWFFYNLFSIHLLLLSLFAPFERLDEHYGKIFEFQKMFESFVVNVLMRVVGFCIRIFTIVIGIAILAAVFFGGIFFLIIWFLAPLVLLFLLSSGVFLLFV
jgi:hypothetical protein